MVTNRLSASDDFCGFIANCALTLYSLRVLRAHDMCYSALQTIFRSVIVAKLLYASSAWWGFTNATTGSESMRFFRRSIRCGFCPPDLPFEEQCQAADEQLFDKLLANNNHVLHSLLPPRTVTSQNYNLTPRSHNRQLIFHSRHLTDSNFSTRVLYSNIYWLIILIS